MNINSIQVIKGSPGSGFDNPSNPVTIQALPGEKLELEYGDTLRVNVGLEYRGPAQEVTLYGALGKQEWWGFNEVLVGQNTIQLPDSLDFVLVPGSFDITITPVVTLGITYSIYSKIIGYSAAGQPRIDNVVDIVGAPPDNGIPPEEEEVFPWVWVIVGAGALLAVGGIAVAMRKRKPTPVTRKRIASKRR